MTGVMTKKQELEERARGRQEMNDAISRIRGHSNGTKVCPPLKTLIDMSPFFITQLFDENPGQEPLVISALDRLYRNVGEDYNPNNRDMRESVRIAKTEGIEKVQEYAKLARKMRY